MGSKYDGIKTAADLVAEVRAHGLSLSQDDLNRAADIFGNTAVKELVRLANDIGRNNDAGEPDPKGSWNSDRPATQSTFYSIASHIWNWEEVTRFWNLHTNPEHEELVELREKLKKEMAEHAETKKSLRHEYTEHQAEKGRVLDLKVRVETLESEACHRDMTIMELKAKLYDLMVARSEK